MILPSVMKLRLPVAVLLLLALPVFGSAPLTVVAPEDGAVLRGGSVATIAWTATELPPGVVEWEAFLSVNGGRYYATRITPHLDIDIREFEWRVPNVTSNDVRLLIRIGDEVEEKSVDVPLRFSIVADPSVWPTFTSGVHSRGEPARPGDPGVTEWATGDRGGHRVGHKRALPDSCFNGTTTIEAAAIRHFYFVSPVVAALRPSLTVTSTIAIAPGMRAFSPLLTRDILLLARRRNI